ncbi:LysM peptidoglycan-binding domain-containing protein [Hymenobacter aerilatus]|uniref:LysM peptidoglycan-binding domain-containing protein n=1 Tax=Hymenobacter aerilatus TaxID=2932251 RepID=A0A8T9SZY1_9BACT|nr:LysM domain-containing protein [Hymenobacter aerilatus]UOR06494.1 LysM peptidoglycan-binding domain-containing protein [Hymenobacter aerilatus]
MPDSIGVEYRGNKMLIKHLVTAGETLYGLSRRYKVTVESIVEANPQLQGALVKGQVVLVPRTRVVLTPAPAARATAAAPATAITPAARALPTDARGNHVYTVKPGQTLFSIAQRFGVSTTDLIRLNRLPASGTVNANQLLVIVPAPAGGVVAAKPTPTRPAPVAPVPAATTPAAPRPEDPDRNRPKETPAPAETTATDDPEDERAPEHASEIVSRVRESGLAAIIEGSTTEKYLALHKTAPVGTIMQVRNIMNGQSVYVRVIGHLPDTGDNANMLVRLSPRAVQRLVTPDQRFRVETSYVP